MRNKQENAVLVFFAVLFVVFVCFIGNKFYHLLVDVVETKQYYVSSKYWKATQQECEDYQEYVCRPVTDCRNIGGDRVCKNETECEWETKTRIHNVWIREGFYPDKPRYTEHYPLSSSRYEKKWMEYYIYFKNNDDTFYKYTRDENYYDSFNLEEVYKADFNYFGVVINLYK